MSRLIYADKLIEDLKEYVENIKNIRDDGKCFLTEENVLSIIKEQPTAYDVDKEVWADIQGYEGLYQISSFGSIKSLARYRKNNGGSKAFVKERILKQSKNNKGYSTIQLCKNGIAKPYSVHRLVAIAFVPNPNNLPEVNHKDEDKNNNNFNNLEWVTTKDNINYGTHNKRSAMTRSYKVQAFNDKEELIMEFDSMCEAERQTGINEQNISRCCANKSKHAGGYVWKISKAGGLDESQRIN